MKKVIYTPRAKSIYWQRLRKDLLSNICCGFMAISILISTISWIDVLVSGNHFQMRANPLYWLLMVPAVIWWNGVAYFKPWINKTFVLVVILSPTLMFGSFYFEYKNNIFEFPSGRLVFSFICLMFSAAAYITYRRSMLYHEGPFMGQP